MHSIFNCIFNYYMCIAYLIAYLLFAFTLAVIVYFILKEKRQLIILSLNRKKYTETTLKY